jgi:YD repeat-containing protein
MGERSVTHPRSTSFTWPSLGDMLTKGDVGTYTYPPTGSPQPHGVSSINAGATTFTYDADGNVTAEGGATQHRSPGETRVAPGLRC